MVGPANAGRLGHLCRECTRRTPGKATVGFQSSLRHFGVQNPGTANEEIIQVAAHDQFTRCVLPQECIVRDAVDMAHLVSMTTSELLWPGVLPRARLGHNGEYLFPTCMPADGTDRQFEAQLHDGLTFSPLAPDSWAGGVRVHIARRSTTGSKVVASNSRDDDDTIHLCQVGTRPHR